MAANEKKPTIVIKKITVVAAGGHGGSWKVAFADFMTAMMAFFLVMWLVNQSEEVKKSVADYFSTPSIIEYNFSNYGVQLTLEKLFLDLVNEPLRAFEQFIMPADKKPNVMDMGMEKIQTHFLADKIGEFATTISITSDEITFDIAEEHLFKGNTANPGEQFVAIMERVRGIIEGLRDSDIYINSEKPYLSGQNSAVARGTAEARLDFILHKVEQSIESETVDIFGKITVEKITSAETRRDRRGYIKFRITTKDKPKDTRADAAAAASPSGVPDKEIQDTYDNFVDGLTKKAEGRDN